MPAEPQLIRAIILMELDIGWIHSVAGVPQHTARLAFVTGPDLPPLLNPVGPEQMEGVLVGFYREILDPTGKPVPGFLLSEIDSPAEAKNLFEGLDIYGIKPTIAKTMIVSLMAGLRPLSAPEIKSEIARLFELAA